jgi:hypothetical protein
MALAVIVCLSATLAVGAAAFAGSASKTAAPGGSSAVPIRNAGVVTAGSTWTMYDLAFGGSPDTMDYGPCEVLSFENSGIFTGDKGDVGHWSGSIKIKFTNNTFFPDGTYSAKVVSDLGGEGEGFQGDDQTGAAWGGVGPLRLYQGDDPLSPGPTC